jgi:hypothetical protein
MPVGTALRDLIAHKLMIKYADGRLKSGDEDLAEVLRRAHGNDWNQWRAAGCKVAEGIEYSNSIDDYLQTHHGDEKIELCAKVAIVQSILQHERKCALFVNEGAHQDWQNRGKVNESWLPPFFRMLQQGVSAGNGARDICKNLCVINFNYDRCFEHFLCRALRGLFQMKEGPAYELMKGLKVFHPYGVVGQQPWQGGRVVTFGADYGDLIGASREIRTFNEKIEEGTELQAMREEISRAARIVFLGFHFHPQNMELLRSVPPARGGSVAIYATAVDRSAADQMIIESRIREMLSTRGGSWNLFVERGLDCRGLLKDYAATLLS